MGRLALLLRERYVYRVPQCAYLANTHGLLRRGDLFPKRILLLLKGRSPYIDFDYQYGPALLQFPAYLYGLLAPWGVTLKATYYALHAQPVTPGFFFSLRS